MKEHITLAKKSYDTEIFKNNPTEAEVLSKYLKNLDEIIAKILNYVSTKQ